MEGGLERELVLAFGDVEERGGCVEAYLLTIDENFCTSRRARDFEPQLKGQRRHRELAVCFLAQG